MKFIIGQTEFKIEDLINARRGSDVVCLLINVLQSVDTSYEVHEPLEADIIKINDNWACHIADKSGVTFEFSNGRLCYVSIRFSQEELHACPVLHISDDILIAIVELSEHYTEYAFGSFNIFSDENLIPNRYALTILSLKDVYELSTRYDSKDS